MLDLTMTRDWIEKKSSLVGQTFTNIDGHVFTVLNYYSNKKFRVRFQSGFETFSINAHIRSGKIIDRLSPTVSAVGCIGYASMKDHPKEYHKWKAMLSRCYIETDKRYYSYGAKGVTVCDRWKRFDFYLEDLPFIDGYEEELYHKGKLVLDKDTKIEGNKIYSLETCKFITVAENTKFSVKRTKGIGIKVYSAMHDIDKSYDSISAFCKEFKLNRHSIKKYINTDKEYKNFLFYTEE